MATKPAMATAAPVRGKPDTKRAPKDAENKKEREKKVKTDFMTVVSKDALNEAGLLTRVPTIGDEYIPRDMDRLARENFASEDLWLEHQANVFQIRGEGMIARAKRLRAEAENSRKFGDPESRKKLKRAAKLRDQLAILMAQLKSEGIEVDEEGDEDLDDEG